MVLSFQNCSNDANFSQDQTREIDTGPFGTNGGGGADEVPIDVRERPSDRHVNDGSPVVDYDVLVPDEEVVEVVCRLNGVIVECDPEDRIVIDNQQDGENTFTIEVTTTDGRTGSETITWTVYDDDDIVKKEKTFEVTTIGEEVDIIVNIDNSGSMRYEQESMASRVADLMAPFKDLKYHIAVTTTSPIGSATIWKASLNYVDGKFVPLKDGSYCIKSETHDYATSQELLSDAVVRDLYLRDENGNQVPDGKGGFHPEGNGWERGIFTTYRAFERVVAGQQGEACLRAGVPKHVILISDEDETLSSDINVSLPNPEKSVGANLVNYVASAFGSDTLFKFHSIIVVPGTSEGTSCLNGHGGRFGSEYYDLSQDTGGDIGTVCATNYASQLGKIGESILNSSRSQQLECQALDNLGGVEKISPAGNLNAGYQFNADKVEFDGDLNPGTYKVTYYCVE